MKRYRVEVVQRTANTWDVATDGGPWDAFGSVFCGRGVRIGLPKNLREVVRVTDLETSETVEFEGKDEEVSCAP